MSNPRPTSSPRSNISREQDRDVRARVWLYIFECYEKKKALQGEDPAHEEKTSASPKKTDMPDDWIHKLVSPRHSSPLRAGRGPAA
jgi:hypothetical protein